MSAAGYLIQPSSISETRNQKSEKSSEEEKPKIEKRPFQAFVFFSFELFSDFEFLVSPFRSPVWGLKFGGVFKLSMVPANQRIQPHNGI